MKICGRDFSKDTIKRIQSVVDMVPAISRRALSKQVCDMLDWKGRNGKPKDMSCRVALQRLHRREQIVLPKAQAFPTAEPKEAPVSLVEVSCTLGELGSVEIIPVGKGNREMSGIWNTIMARYHYLGKGPLCGAQIRYLIKSSTYGWLGGLSFSSSAWRVADRDQFIGWSEEARRENLSQVVCNSRFLISPTVRVPHLASHILSRCIKRLGQDWLERYDYTPVMLETYVEQGRFRGTCYRAANWQKIGETRGRGRQDRDQACAVPVKDVYVYPLRRDAATILCKQTVKPIPPVLQQKPAADWAEEEFGSVNLGDRRLSHRLVTIARDFYARPQASIPQACQTRANTKATYRFFEHPATHMDILLSQHTISTLERCKKESIVLAAQDTTSLNYSAHPATANIGPIGSYKDGPIGLLVHDTMAFNIDGVPLGLLDVQSWARDPDDFGKKAKRHTLPIEEKESYKWLRSYEKVAEAQRTCPDTMFISLGDREADIYELFALASANPSAPKLLVRAKQNRTLDDNQGHLWQHLESLETVGIQELHVPRQKNRQSRIAQLEVRFAEVTLKPPGSKQSLNPLPVWAVFARESNPPEDVVPLEWMLLTTCPVSNFEQAVEKLEWYAKRWGIEVYHRTLKSGCKIEERQLGHAERIESCLAIDMVVAWRIYYLTKLGRGTPDLPCTVFFEEAEWRALKAYKHKDASLSAKPPTLREALIMVAMLGGFLGRKCDGEPGTKSIWLGLQRLDDLAHMWRVLVEHIQPKRDPPFL
ncbi:MAG: IS4 family transposase [Desulfamplus sp.]|nr:IS4 family transposase [Desulfamplus sp.]